jgi:poly-gamma-glutamate capsule biosynthesis protein CapA/YwtB (metallophosphatase superfamily)
MRIFLCGDVMTGRGIDQILASPCAPGLHEACVRSAEGYVWLAERVNGPVPRRVEGSFIWGAALEEWRRAKPDLRIVNLETSITRSEAFVAKGINYRMSPENAACLSAAGLDCCLLANNHVLDWGRPGLLETLAVLERLGIKTAGAGRTAAAAGAPAVLEAGGRRVLVFAWATLGSGTPSDWAATANTPGINLLRGEPQLSGGDIETIATQVAAFRRPGDLVVIGLHWGANWGHAVPIEQRWFARELIDRIDAAVVHGHSSHHAKAIEVYRNRLILYGCGDFLNDYEGIGGYEAYRPDLALMYFAEIAAEGADLAGLDMVPLQIRQFRLNRAAAEDVRWLRHVLDTESRRFGARVGHHPGRGLRLVPVAAAAGAR